MRFGTFTFPQSRDPSTDYSLIHEALREVELAEEIGMDVALAGRAPLYGKGGLFRPGGLWHRCGHAHQPDSNWIRGS